MSATRPTPETDAATFWGRDMGGDKGPPHFECVDADVARKFECERDEMVEQIVQLRRQITSHQETEDANLDDMRQTMRETADILAQIPAAYDSRFFRAGQWANAALAKLQPFIKP